MVRDGGGKNGGAGERESVCARREKRGEVKERDKLSQQLWQQPHGRPTGGLQLTEACEQDNGGGGVQVGEVSEKKED